MRLIMLDYTFIRGLKPDSRIQPIANRMRLPSRDPLTANVNSANIYCYIVP
jgi:hypothetical protein